MIERGLLDEVGLRHGTDKSSSHHNYLNFYENFFHSIRCDKLRILEVCVFDGASLRTWDEYFPNALVTGADIRPSTLVHSQDRVSVELMDQSDIEDLTRVALNQGPFDIIVEDGSPMWEHQITTLRTLFPFLRNNGLYIAEDLQTNYGDAIEAYRGVASESYVEYLKRLIDLTVADTQVALEGIEDPFLRTYGRSAEYITFYRRACLIRKKHQRQGKALNGSGSLISTLFDNEMDVPVRLLVHVSHKGNIFGSAGFINSGVTEHTFQGISISCIHNLLQHRVRWGEDEWSDWSKGQEYIGTTGQYNLITGTTFKLMKAYKDNFALRTIGRFIEIKADTIATDGQDCTGDDVSPMYGIKIILTEEDS